MIKKLMKMANATKEGTYDPAKLVDFVDLKVAEFKEAQENSQKAAEDAKKAIIEVKKSETKAEKALLDAEQVKLETEKLLEDIERKEGEVRHLETVFTAKKKVFDDEVKIFNAKKKKELKEIADKIASAALALEEGEALKAEYVAKVKKMEEFLNG